MIILRERRKDNAEDAGWREETEEDDWPVDREEMAGFLWQSIYDADEAALVVLLDLARRMRVKAVVDKIGTPAKQKATKEFIISLLPDFGFTWNGREVVPL